MVVFSTRPHMLTALFLSASIWMILKSYHIVKYFYDVKDWVSYPYPFPDSKVHGANMGPIWGRQDPGGPHVGPMNFAIWVGYR